MKRYVLLSGGLDSTTTAFAVAESGDPVECIAIDAPVGVTSTVEVAKSLLRRSEIEFSVEGKRPALVHCGSCGRPIVIPRRGRIRRWCLGGCLRSIKFHADADVEVMIEKERDRLSGLLCRGVTLPEAAVSLIRRGAGASGS